MLYSLYVVQEHLRSVVRQVNSGIFKSVVWYFEEVRYFEEGGMVLYSLYVVQEHLRSVVRQVNSVIFNMVVWYFEGCGNIL